MRSQKQIIAAMERAKVKLAKVRDELREIEDEVQQFREVCDDAVESFEYTIETLSQFV